ncbi:hypothetical protein FN846DRAFT_127536 [Sphaerosporella brunnea]|uniref:Uncharacterized protein n=1 Tax=Sphaerosporella brunnea TaxID=1250544 RepID=A0A5J5ERW4_9PEZI|nr:hypothetical protein FN846DRAFT_127536 [Sphaerosporella brunnea]
MYMFPRQHGLHNVFTSVVNKQETTHPFQDYTYREPEIEELKTKRDGKDIPVPKRLKGPVLALVMVMQKLHRNCPYHALVKHYCPVSVFQISILASMHRARARLQSILKAVASEHRPKSHLLSRFQMLQYRL